LFDSPALSHVRYDSRRRTIQARRDSRRPLGLQGYAPRRPVRAGGAPSSDGRCSACCAITYCKPSHTGQGEDVDWSAIARTAGDGMLLSNSGTIRPFDSICGDNNLGRPFESFVKGIRVAREAKFPVFPRPSFRLSSVRRRLQTVRITNLRMRSRSRLAFTWFAADAPRVSTPQILEVGQRRLAEHRPQSARPRSRITGAGALARGHSAQGETPSQAPSAPTSSKRSTSRIGVSEMVWE